jgi:hypothetical protein
MEMIDEDKIQQRFVALSPHLDERGRRQFAAVEARLAGYGGIAALALTTAALANDPLLGGAPGKVVGDKELASVKGSEPYAQYYGYLGQYILIMPPCMEV